MGDSLCHYLFGSCYRLSNLLYNNVHCSKFIGVAIIKTSSIVIILSVLVALFAGFSAAVGLFYQNPGAEFSFTTLRGSSVQIFGQGLYFYDTVFFGAGYRGQDLVSLFIGIPLLVIAAILFQRGLASGHLFLVGMLGYFLYLNASMALGAAYNSLFLLYIAAFSASLFGFILAFSSVDFGGIAARIPAGLPRRGLAVFMIFAGAVTLFAWGMPVVDSLLKGFPPDRMDSYTTMMTYALDLAIITPSTFLCAFLVLRNQPLGYVIASPLLTVIILLAPQITLSTIFQRSAGIQFTPGEMVGPVAGFVVLGLAAAWLLIDMLRKLTPASSDDI
jgi:hypothetical protein